MASDKKKRKQNESTHATPKPGPFRHPDGDRRRRGGLTADQGIRDKRARQTFDGGVPVDDPPPTDAA